MGTNYYSVRRGFDYESAESLWDLRGTEDCIHIGKSSMGWCFSLHVVPELGINNLDDWIRMFIEPDRFIIDEYGSKIQYTEMLSIITARRREREITWSDEFMKQNCAEPGPNGLYRHSLDHDRMHGCVGNGEGTWDYITGEFS